MFANSCNVSFEKAETGKRGRRLSYTPAMLIPKPETTFLLISGVFRKKCGSDCLGCSVREMDDGLGNKIDPFGK